MTTSQKAALTLLISVLLFGAFTALAFTGLFDLLEARYYNPTITANITREVSRNAESIEEFLVDLQNRFAESLANPSVERSFLPNQSAEDIFERTRIYGLFTESIAGLQWIRFIDLGGSRIHFSTYAPDVLYQDRLSLSYRNYSDEDLPYRNIAVPDHGVAKFTFDENADRILFSFPFYDSFDVYRGTALFSLSIKAVSDMLISDGRMKVSQNLSIVSNPAGFISGIPASSEKELTSWVSSVWREGVTGTTGFNSVVSGVSLELVSVKTNNFYVGRFVNEDMFSFPLTLKIILLVSSFLTVYLTIFLLFNLRQDSVTIVQNRLKQLQISMIEQYYDNKSDIDWERWSRDLEHRREEINSQLKRGLRIASGKKTEDLDALIDKSWDELITVIGGRKETGVEDEKLEVILSRILAALPKAAFPAVSNTGAALPKTSVTADVEEIEALEEVETLGEVEAVDAAEEIEALEEVETLEEVGAVEAAEEIETLGEAESVEEIEALEDADAVEEVEAAEAAGEIKTAEAVEEIEALEEVESADESAVAVAEPALIDEVPEIDLADLNISAAEADGVIQAMGANEAVEELEEISSPGVAESVEGEAVEELEELGDSADEIATESSSSDSSSAPSRDDIASLASQIEFSQEPEIDNTPDDDMDMEVVSPFSTMLSGFKSLAANGIRSDADDNSEEDQETQEAEEMPEDVEGISRVSSGFSETETMQGKEIVSLIPRSFFNMGVANIETLEVLPGEDEDDLAPLDDEDPDSVIKEKEGVHYINGDAIKAGSESSASYNQDFKDLVDSIIK